MPTVLRPAVAVETDDESYLGIDVSKGQVGRAAVGEGQSAEAAPVC